MGAEVIVGQILFIVSVAIIGLLSSRLTKIDYTLTCLLAGFIAGLLLPSLGIDTGVRANNLQSLVFYVILPVLIFEAAWHIKPELLKNWIKPILVLATAGVLFSTLICAGLLYFSIGNPAGFPWMAALLTGAILAATDPISVVAKLKASKAPEDLATLIEGESLFNDATVIVLFSLILMAITGTNNHADNPGFILFLETFFGGILLGSLAGLIAAIVVLIQGSSAVSKIILLFVAFGSFYVAEHLLHVSGIMAVMGAAIVSRMCLREHEHRVLEGTEATWDWLGLLFNSIIFSLMGLVITPSMFSDQWLAIIIAITAALIARAVTVYLSTLITKPLTWNIKPQWNLLLILGGLRGAIAIALVLALPVTLEYWWTIQSMVFGVVLFNLFVQGMTITPLIKKILANA